MIEVRELLPVWMSGVGLRRVGALAGVDRKTARDYTNAAVLAGLGRDGGLDQLTDELIGSVIEAVRPDRPDGHGHTWEVLCANHGQIVEWVEKGLTVVKIGDLLAAPGHGGAAADPAPLLHAAHRLSRSWQCRHGAGGRR